MTCFFCWSATAYCCCFPLVGLFIKNASCCLLNSAWLEFRRLLLMLALLAAYQKTLLLFELLALLRPPVSRPRPLLRESTTYLRSYRKIRERLLTRLDSTSLHSKLIIAQVKDFSISFVLATFFLRQWQKCFCIISTSVLTLLSLKQPFKSEKSLDSSIHAKSFASMFGYGRDKSIKTNRPERLVRSRLLSIVLSFTIFSAKMHSLSSISSLKIV